MTCSLDYNYRLNSSHSLKVQQLHFNQKTKKERKRIVLHFSLSHTHPHKHTHPQCIPTWLPLCLLFTLWDEQILGCNFYFLPLPSASLITAVISVLSCGKLWQWWFRAFGACESVNVCAWGCVTNVAVCWALHALIVRCRGCAYTQSLMRGRVRVCDVPAGRSKGLKDFWETRSSWDNLSIFQRTEKMNPVSWRGRTDMITHIRTHLL